MAMPWVALQVSRVYYPGLPACRDHERAQELFGGLGGGVLAFEVKGGVAAANALLLARGPARQSAWT